MSRHTKQEQIRELEIDDFIDLMVTTSKGGYQSGNDSAKFHEQKEVLHAQLKAEIAVESSQKNKR